jgi:hypothetical protein
MDEKYRWAREIVTRWRYLNETGSPVVYPRLAQPPPPPTICVFCSSYLCRIPVRFVPSVIPKGPLIERLEQRGLE